jgi:F-type H+-transporting ATPase subunit a
VLLVFGPLQITDTVLSTWGLMLVLTLLCVVFTRRLTCESPSKIQVLLESTVSLIESLIADILPEQARKLVPFIGTLWLFLVFANLLGLIPGLHSPTGNLSITAALAIVVFLSVHWYGIQHDGLKNYLRHYLSPTPLMLPFHLISEITRTLALAIRLFGNIASLEMAALLVLLVAGFLVPVPLLLLHVIEALVQAYIFGMLALVYIAGGIQSQQQHKDKREKSS